MIDPTQTPVQRLVALDLVTFDDSLQMRATGVDTAFADHLAELLREDDEVQLTPIELYQDAATHRYFLADGHHRAVAYRYAGRKEIPALIRLGGWDAAFRAALQANADQHTKPRTRADVARAVHMALKKFYWEASPADRATQEQIADLCRCDRSYVARILKREKSARDAEARAKVAAAEAAANPFPVRQFDFFERLNQDYEPVLKQWESVLKMPYWVLIDIPKKDKLEAIEAIRNSLKKQLRDLDKHEELVNNIGRAE